MNSCFIGERCRQAQSVTSLETALSCPFRKFVERDLGLDDPGLSLDAALTGTVLHSCLQDLAQRLMQESDGVAQDGKLDEYRTYVLDSFDRRLANKVGECFPDTVRSSAEMDLVDSIRRRLPLFVERICRLLPGYRIWKTEYPVEGEFAGLKVKGRVDRIDHDGGNIVLIDYKSGAVDPFGSGFYQALLCNKGYAIQMAAYAKILMDQGIDGCRIMPRACLYLSAKGAVGGAYDALHFDKDEVQAAGIPKNCAVPLEFKGSRKRKKEDKEAENAFYAENPVVTAPDFTSYLHEVENYCRERREELLELGTVFFDPSSEAVQSDDEVAGEDGLDQPMSSVIAPKIPGDWCEYCAIAQSCAMEGVL